MKISIGVFMMMVCPMPASYGMSSSSGDLSDTASLAHRKREESGSLLPVTSVEFTAVQQYLEGQNKWDLRFQVSTIFMPCTNESVLGVHSHAHAFENKKDGRMYARCGVPETGFSEQIKTKQAYALLLEYNLVHVLQWQDSDTKMIEVTGVFVSKMKAAGRSCSKIIEEYRKNTQYADIIAAYDAQKKDAVWYRRILSPKKSPILALSPEASPRKKVVHFQEPTGSDRESSDSEDDASMRLRKKVRDLGLTLGSNPELCKRTFDDPDDADAGGFGLSELFQQ